MNIDILETTIAKIRDDSSPVVMWRSRSISFLLAMIEYIDVNNKNNDNIILMLFDLSKMEKNVKKHSGLWCYLDSLPDFSFGQKESDYINTQHLRLMSVVYPYLVDSIEIHKK